ncbi:alpha/beta hydrolase [Deinococcus detaillensis]|uniref:Alpha/beta hydrolase n=1 Tax=Deinococcus detaillensis TaxID=2592048 RepID=A0A553US48_9DEIO|nr:alpha/beta fold hydrolase [Deinococcus detaillensis]TSA83012.1 alpha/beta hydrolase [Deinococcus detaillensis]
MSKKHTLGLWIAVAALGLSVTLGRAGAQADVGSSSVLSAQTAAIQPSGLRSALDAERRFVDVPGFGAVAYYLDTRGSGRPLVLTTSINAAASAYEMKPLFDTYVGTRPIYVLEWPGFGSSDRPDAQYTPELMTRALSALLDKIGQDVDVVSLSLGSEFVARAALSDTRIKSLALISPSGLGSARGGTQRARDEDGGQKLYGRLKTFGTPLFALIRSQPSVLYFLNQSFVGPVDDGLFRYSLESSDQPGGKYAPLYFISGRLFTPDAYEQLYSKLSIPVLVLYDKDNFVNFDRLPEWVTQGNVSATRIVPSNGLPQFEKLPEVKVALDGFWQSMGLQGK